MDKDQVERMKRHYDLHAKAASTPEALRKREQGRAIQLKRFHNDVKRALIEEFGRDSLLDLGCGRGGDLNKWLDAGLRDVVGVDLSPKEIEEATRRFRELQADLRSGKRRPSRGGGNLVVEFHQTDQLGTVSPLLFGREGGSLDGVTCMFALHYFFETEVSARHLLTTVSAALRPGGFFFGVLPDGERVSKKLQGRGAFSNEMFRLKLGSKEPAEAGAAAGGGEEEANATGTEQDFGRAYEFALSDTVTGAVEDSGGSREFMVFERTLVAMAAELGMKPVGEYRSHRLKALLEAGPDGGLFRHFAPRYTGPDGAALTEASELNCAFVLRKEGGAEESGNRRLGEREREREGGGDQRREMGGREGGREQGRDGVPRGGREWRDERGNERGREGRREGGREGERGGDARWRGEDEDRRRWGEGAGGRRGGWHDGRGEWSGKRSWQGERGRDGEYGRRREEEWRGRDDRYDRRREEDSRGRDGGRGEWSESDGGRGQYRDDVRHKRPRKGDWE